MIGCMDTTTQAPGRRRTDHASQADIDHVGNMGRYLYQIRNMLAWILILAGLTIAGGIIAGIVVASHHPAAACQSQGGTDPAC